MDSHDHLFFNGDYSKEVWQALKINSRIHGIGNNGKDIIKFMKDAIIEDVGLKLVILYVKKSTAIKEVVGIMKLLQVNTADPRLILLVKT
ncbi:hypothetical protein Tco_1086865 [Tanacetum coccineum]